MKRSSGQLCLRREADLTSAYLPDPASESVLILLVEDNPGDVILIREALMDSGPPHKLMVLGDGVDAIEYLRRAAAQEVARPDLILLDLNMPRVDGGGVVDFILGTPEIRDLPVVVLSSSESPRDVSKVDTIPRGLYIVKPSDLDQFLQIGNRVKVFLAGLKG